MTIHTQPIPYTHNGPLWLEGIEMKHQSYFVNGLTTNQKTFLLSNGCTVEPYIVESNHWVSMAGEKVDGVKVTVKNKQGKAAWGLIQNSDLLIIPIKDYTKKPLSGTRVNWVSSG